MHVRVSELVTQGKLYLSRAVDRAENRAERTIGGPSVRSAKDVAVECIDEVGLQREAVGFRKAHPLDDREILVYVSLTSDFSRDAWHVANR